MKSGLLIVIKAFLGPYVFVGHHVRVAVFLSLFPVSHTNWTKPSLLIGYVPNMHVILLPSFNGVGEVGKTNDPAKKCVNRNFRKFRQEYEMGRLQEKRFGNLGITR